MYIYICKYIHTYICTYKYFYRSLYINISIYQYINIAISRYIYISMYQYLSTYLYLLLIFRHCIGPASHRRSAPVHPAHHPRARAQQGLPAQGKYGRRGYLWIVKNAYEDFTSETCSNRWFILSNRENMRILPVNMVIYSLKLRENMNIIWTYDPQTSQRFHQQQLSFEPSKIVIYHNTAKRQANTKVGP